MKLFTLADIVHITAATWVNAYQQPTLVVTHVTIDSRQTEVGSLFIALEGSRTQGWHHLREVADKGAVAALVPKNSLSELDLALWSSSLQLLAVDSPLWALQQLAQAHVAKFPQIRRIGITGSVGKTTTKEMLASIFSVVAPTAKTPGNYNSLIGLPLALFSLNAETKYGLFELGIDQTGEMEQLVEIYRPELAVITNIGPSHLEKLYSVTTVAREKSKIFHKELEAAFLAENEPYGSYIEQLSGHKSHRFGSLEKSGITKVQQRGLAGWRFHYEGVPINLAAIGTHNLNNALAAIAISRFEQIPPEAIKIGLERYQPLAGRSRVVSGDITVIEDCYNASFASTTSMLSYLHKLPWRGAKHLVLGSMKELGELSVSAHRLIGRQVAKLNPHTVTLYGKEMRSAQAEIERLGYSGNLLYSEDFSEVYQQVGAQTTPGDLVLIKGSRSMQMERLLPALNAI